jgi:hypothetical protein
MALFYNQTLNENLTVLLLFPVIELGNDKKYKLIKWTEDYWKEESQSKYGMKVTYFYSDILAYMHTKYILYNPIRRNFLNI